MSQSNPEGSLVTQGDLSAMVIAKGVLGAIAGGVLGFFAFEWLSSVGLYAIVLPGAFVGLGCGMLARNRSIFFAVFCFVIGIVSSLLGEWHTKWFVDDAGNDQGLAYFIQHIHQSRGGIALIAVLLNGVIAGWLGRRG